MVRTVEAGQTLYEVECEGCKQPVALKVNSKGNVGYFCARIVGENSLTHKPERCYTRQNFGRKASQEIINEYLEELANEKNTGKESNSSESAEESNQETDSGEIGSNERGSGERDRPAGGGNKTDNSNAERTIYSAVKHFLTE